MANKIEVKLNANFTGGGVAGFFTWRRLEQLLHDANELRDDEKISGFRADNDGVTFYIDKRGVNHSYSVDND